MSNIEAGIAAAEAALGDVEEAVESAATAVKDALGATEAAESALDATQARINEAYESTDELLVTVETIIEGGEDDPLDELAKVSETVADLDGELKTRGADGLAAIGALKQMGDQLEGTLDSKVAEIQRDLQSFAEAVAGGRGELEPRLTGSEQLIEGVGDTVEQAISEFDQRQDEMTEGLEDLEKDAESQLRAILDEFDDVTRKYDDWSDTVDTHMERILKLAEQTLEDEIVDKLQETVRGALGPVREALESVDDVAERGRAVLDGKFRDTLDRINGVVETIEPVKDVLDQVSRLL